MKRPKSQSVPGAFVSPHPAYDTYIRSPEWKAVRRRKLAEQPRCEACGSDERLECHHVTYDRLGFEEVHDLEVLCHWCHMLEHRRPASGFPAAGPTIAEFAARARDRDAMLRRQRRLLDAVPILRLAETAKDLRENRAIRTRARNRLKMVERECVKLAQEMVAS